YVLRHLPARATLAATGEKAGRITRRCTGPCRRYGSRNRARRGAGPAGDRPYVIRLRPSPMADDIVELDLGVRPEAAVSGAICLQTEGVTFLTFNAMRPTDRMSPYGIPYV